MAQVGRAFRQAAALDRRGDTLAECGHQLRCYSQPLAELAEIIGNSVEMRPNPAYDASVWTCRECGARIQL